MSAVLVTGASGFIGGAVVDTLRAAGIVVVTAGRHGADCSLDLTAPGPIVLPRGLHAVLHLAGEKTDPARMAAVNAQAAQCLVDAAAAAGASSFVHLSSVGVYGARKHAGVVTESTPHTPRGPYESSKDDGERRVRQRCAQTGLRCAVLQPSNVIGTRGGRQPLLGLVRAVAGARYIAIGPPRAWVNYVAVDDVAAAMLAAVQSTAAGTWIVNTPAPLHELVRWIAETLGCPPPTRRLPLWLGALAAGAAGPARTLLRRELPLSPERFLEMTNSTRFDGSAIRRELAFSYPVGVEATVRGLAACYRRAALA